FTGTRIVSYKKVHPQIQMILEGEAEGETSVEVWEDGEIRDRVAAMLPNVPQYAVAIAAILRAGFVLVNVNPETGKAQRALKNVVVPVYTTATPAPQQ
ncbi:MAG: hypothetical protein HGA84_06810, partial [Syntrophobacteraceae bacterium]|nr:hypothetical protein [Syntrophobacteraceae bacterium]